MFASLDEKMVHAVETLIHCIERRFGLNNFLIVDILLSLMIGWSVVVLYIEYGLGTFDLPLFESVVFILPLIVALRVSRREESRYWKQGARYVNWFRQTPSIQFFRFALSLFLLIKILPPYVVSIIHFWDQVNFLSLGLLLPLSLIVSQTTLYLLACIPVRRDIV